MHLKIAPFPPLLENNNKSKVCPGFRKSHFLNLEMECCVPGCVGDVASTGLPFPSGSVMRYKWHRAIQIRPSSGAKVCEKHFRPDDFETDLKSKEKVLKIDVVPSVFSPGRLGMTKTVPSLMGERVRFRQRTQRPAEAIETFIYRYGQKG